MTNEKAANELTELANSICLIPTTSKGQAMLMAIKALEQEQEPCEDCVSRDEVIHCLERLATTDIPQLKLYGQKIADAMSELPSVYPKQRKSSWVRGKNDSTLFFCRRCGKRVNPYWKYCPNCGAKMEVDT